MSRMHRNMFTESRWCCRSTTFTNFENRCKATWRFCCFLGRQDLCTLEFFLNVFSKRSRRCFSFLTSPKENCPAPKKNNKNSDIDSFEWSQDVKFIHLNEIIQHPFNKKHSHARLFFASAPFPVNPRKPLCSLRSTSSKRIGHPLLQQVSWSQKNNLQSNLSYHMIW